MKSLFIFPPQWMPVSPHLGILSLTGQFENTPYEANALDLNVDFYNYILTSKNILQSYKVAKAIYHEITEEIKLIYDKNIRFEDYHLDWQNKILKASMLKKSLKHYEKHIETYAAKIEKNINILKSKEHFYNRKLYKEATEIINASLDICSMPFYPAKLSLSNYSNELLKLDYKLIQYYVFDKTTNIFVDYFKNKLPEIKAQNADFIGISISSQNQIIAGLTLANILKTETNAHINIGGNHFSRVSDAFEKYPDFFDKFCDSVSIAEGEQQVVELAKHIAEKTPIEDIPNIIYCENGKIKYNKTKFLNINDIKPISLNGIDLKKYFTPEIVIPIQSSRGCYWQKCTFCDHDFGLCYNVKDLDKLVSEIKILKEKYKITKFEFIDAAISPSYLKAMSERFIEEKLDITFFCNARLENAFTKDIFELAKKAGLKMILWGFESGSPKIMKLINKGVDIDNRIKIMQTAQKAGIYNFAFIFFGFPAETKEDAMMTIDAIFNNTKIINSYVASPFILGKHTEIKEHPEKYGIKGEIFQDADFSPKYIYNAIGMSEKELSDIFNICSKKTKKKYGEALSFKILTREMMLLYLDRHRLEYVCKFKY